MPKYRVEGTSGGCDQRVIEADGVQDAIEKYLYYPGFGGLINDYDEHSDPGGTYRQSGHKGNLRWSRLTISVSPPFEACAFEGCDAGDDYEEFDDGLCYDHQPDPEDEDDDE